MARRNNLSVKLKNGEVMAVVTQVTITIIAIILSAGLSIMAAKGLKMEGSMEQDQTLAAILVYVYFLALCVFFALTLSTIASAIMRQPVAFEYSLKSGHSPSSYMITPIYTLPLAIKEGKKTILYVSFTEQELTRIAEIRTWGQFSVALPLAKYPLETGMNIQLRLSAKQLADIIGRLEPDDNVIFAFELANSTLTRTWPMISLRETSFLLKVMRDYELEEIEVDVNPHDPGQKAPRVFSKDELFDYERRFTNNRDYLFVNRRYF